MTVRDILLTTLRQLEQSKDPQADDPAVVKLRDDIAMAIFRLHIAKGSDGDELKAA